jgi:hypothetical protein
MKDKIEKALLVVVLNAPTREWLRANDPNALKQAFDALHAEGTVTIVGVDLVELRREHCHRQACKRSFKDCECKCGKCTARYGDDGVWR